MLASRSGALLDVEETAAPIHGAGRDVEGVVLVVRDVSAARRAEQSLLDADRRKNEFLAVLSHELRNPLAPIKNSLYVLDRAVPGGAQARNALEVLRRQVDQVSRLVDDLLDVTRITRNKLELERAPLDFAELVRRAVEDQRSLFEEAQIRLEANLPQAPVVVRGDPSRLMQVVGNLLQNAAKFTLPGGTTRVCVAQAPAEKALLSVRDDGLGIPPDAMATLFQPFMQAERGGRRGGLGLGLALVKGLVEQHGGEVTARSGGPGTGSEFTVELPLAESAPAPAGTGKAARAAGVPARPRRVLLIEDNVDVADSMREALELACHQVAVAHDGPEGLRLARELCPEVVLCDIGLPGMDGYEVARALRRDASLARTLLVALSGYALPEDRRHAAQAGFDVHLAKPPSLEKLEELMAGLGASGGPPFGGGGP
ncbi:MAG: ATP-binding protein [Myxococcales bacterium]